MREWQQRVKHAIWVLSVLVSWKDYECRYIFSILVSDTSFKLIIVNCEWSQWSQFGTCSVTCGGGTEERTRTISVPAQNGGTGCAGNDTESQECNTDACPGEKQTTYSYLMLVQTSSNNGQISPKKLPWNSHSSSPPSFINHVSCN